MKAFIYRLIAAALLLAALALPSFVLAQSGGSNSASASPSLMSGSQTFKLAPIPVEQFTLPNGLRVVLSEDHTVPVVSVAVYYNTGSRNERAGRTGFAHLFEHMMFQGSENVGKAEHFKYVYNNGGTLNGSTTTERTNYFETLPSNQLPLALWLESDRMRSLKVTQENLDNQRQAVQEEKRLNFDNKPFINGFIKINELIFKNPTNAHSPIGSMEDLNAATVQDVQEFSASTTRPTTPCSQSSATSRRSRRAHSLRNTSPRSSGNPTRLPWMSRSPWK